MDASIVPNIQQQSRVTDTSPPAQFSQKMKTIDIISVAKKIWEKKRLFLIVWIVTIALSILWIMPQPRYYRCNVTLAPEMSGDGAGSLSSLASNLGFNIGGQSTDAIYPQLYPELFKSPDFVIGLFTIKIRTSDNRWEEDYATYLRKRQKKNWLTEPFKKAERAITSLFTPTEIEHASKHKTNPFCLTKSEYNMMERISGAISCSVDQRTDVITISVRDQDKMVCAIVADSVRQHLQDFIIAYRTQKARIDVTHYETLAESYKQEYNKSAMAYSRFCDAHRNVMLQSVMSERDNLENDMQMKYNAYSAMQNQLEAAKVKLQEKTPAFTTLQSATVPQKPAGPKRIVFVVLMLILSTIVTTGIVLRHEMRELLIFYKE